MSVFTETIVRADELVDRHAVLGALPVSELTEDEVTEYRAIHDLLLRFPEVKDVARNGETLIRDDYFVEYAKDLAAELGYVESPQPAQWPYTCVDWDRAAEELKQDYYSVTFDGKTYHYFAA